MIRTTFLRHLFLPAVAGLMFGIAAQGQAATMPYFQDFDSFDVGTTNPDGFTPSTANWTVEERDSGSGDRQYLGTFAGSGTFNDATTSTLGFPGVAGTNFVLSTDIYIETLDVTGTGGRTSVAGLIALDAYTARWVMSDSTAGNVGKLRLQGGGLTTTNSSGNLAPVEDRLYTMTLVGTYNELGHLTLEATLLDTVTQDSVSVTHAPVTLPLTGENFGYRIGLFTSGNSAIDTAVSFDNFSLVPEPGSLALLGLGGLLMLRRNRRA